MCNPCGWLKQAACLWGASSSTMHYSYIVLGSTCPLQALYYKHYISATCGTLTVMGQGCSIHSLRPQGSLGV
eukprot:1142058-Pelagomonas_calceolata.AAC.5